MAHINLLPWREELRKQKQNDFLAMIGIGVLVTAVLGVIVYIAFSQLISNQEQRNRYLTENIKILDKQIEEIEAIEKEKEQLIARMKAIEELQTTRPLNVRMFDELAARNPDGVSFNELTQKKNNLKIMGVSQSNARVSSLMRNLNASEWLTKPSLEVIEVKENKKGEERNKVRRSHYTIGIDQVVVSDEPEESEGVQGVQ